MADNAELVAGYPRLAHEMGSIPELAIYRRFADLNNQNLLYYQAELVMLERKLRRQERASSISSADTSNSELKDATHLEYAKDWYWLAEEDPNNRQWQTVLRLREVLKDYNEAVLRQVKMAELPEPNQCDLHYLQEWLARHCHQSLKGSDCTVWEDFDPTCIRTDGRTPCDLFVVHPRSIQDPFSTWIVQSLIGWLYREIWCRLRPGERTPETGMTMNDCHILRLTSFLTTAVASLLPVSSIVVLYFVTAMKVRLGLLAAFTFLLALCMSCFTTATRSEIFATTAAFAAVQVVFIGNNGNSTSTPS